MAKPTAIRHRFQAEEGYVYLDSCSKAKPARYDVFYRVSWNVNNTWLCMTAPDGVMKGTKSSGYLRTSSLCA